MARLDALGIVDHPDEQREAVSKPNLSDTLLHGVLCVVLAQRLPFDYLSGGGAAGENGEVSIAEVG